MPDLSTYFEEISAADPEDLADVLDSLPEGVVSLLLRDVGGDDSAGRALTAPPSPLDQAAILDPGYVSRPHLSYLSQCLADAVADVQRGISRRLVVSMPPRMGKSQLSSVYLPVWLLHLNPRWKIGLISHDPSLATAWGRSVRSMIEQHGDSLGLAIASDAGAASEWQTTQRGGITARSAPGQSITGRGFNVLIVDDVVKDFAAAHSEATRKAVWEWWTANAETRLEPPSLVVVIGTRWHEDDFIGRLLSTDYDGDPRDWEVISFPALAEEADPLGRAPGAPLLTPLIPSEDAPAALERWAAIKRSVGEYAWAALYQQRPSPAQGAIFDVGAFRYWTTRPGAATDDGTVVYLDPAAPLADGGLAEASWVDSWDMTFTGSDSSDYVVGQRWARRGADRFLVAQQRGRWSFTQTLARVTEWAAPESAGGTGRHVHRRLVEKAANGAAILDSLSRKVPGLVPVTARVSKESRARAVTPEVESGNVFLPHPGDPGNEWVNDLIAELRNFPNAAHDDQVDSLTQALTSLREAEGGGLSSPARLAPGHLLRGDREGAARRSLTDRPGPASPGQPGDPALTPAQRRRGAPAAITAARISRR